MHVASNRYAVAVFPGADWVANARAAHAATLTVGKRTERVRIVELAPDDAAPLLRLLLAQVPAGVRFLTKSGLITDGTPDELEALAGQVPVFRFDPL